MTQLRPQTQPMMAYAAAPQGYIVNNGYGTVYNANGMMMNAGNSNMPMNAYAMQQPVNRVPVAVPANANNARFYTPSVNMNTSLFSQFQIN